MPIDVLSKLQAMRSTIRFSGMQNRAKKKVAKCPSFAKHSSVNDPSGATSLRVDRGASLHTLKEIAEKGAAPIGELERISLTREANAVVAGAPVPHRPWCSSQLCNNREVFRDAIFRFQAEDKPYVLLKFVYAFKSPQFVCFHNVDEAEPFTPDAVRKPLLSDAASDCWRAVRRACQPMLIFPTMASSLAANRCTSSEAASGPRTTPLVVITVGPRLASS